MRYLLIILSLTLLLPSCQKDNRIRFEERLDLQFDVPSGLNLIETHVFTFNNLNSFSLSNQEVNGYDASDVDEIISASGQLTFPFFNGDFSFIEKIVIRIFDPNNPNSKKEMYYRDLVPFNQGSTLILFSGIADLQPILSNEQFSMEVRLKFRRFVPSNVRINLDFGYNVYLKN